MPWWIVLLIIFAALILIGQIPLGLDAGYDGTFCLKLKIWFFPVVLIPKKAKSKKRDKKPSKKKTEEQEETKKKTDFAKLLEYVDLATELLSDLRSKLVLQLLCLHVFFGGDDPAAQAISYGRAWALLGPLSAALEQIFTIRKRDIEPKMVSSDKKIEFDARAVLTLTVSRTLALVLHALLGYLKLQDKKKGD